MRYLITGAGQIGSQLAHDLTTAGHEVTVLRRSAGAAGNYELATGDAGDREALREAAAGCAAIFHCIHASYSAAVWRRELPHREIAVMDVAAELGIPVVFPESLYAFGRGVAPLTEDAQLAPVTPLGRVRAELLRTRDAHPAHTASVVAGDLIGPTSTRKGSALVATVLAPAKAGNTAWVMGDPDVPHAATYIPDLSRAMIAAMEFACAPGTLLLAPSPEAISQRELADRASATLGGAPIPVRGIPAAALAALAPFSPATRELFRQRYLWNSPSQLMPGRLTSELGLRPTAWEQILESWAAA